MTRPARSSRPRPAPPRGGLTDRLLGAIQTSGLTAYAIAKDSGVDRRNIERFVAGEQGLSLDSADRIAHALGLALVERARAASRKAAPRRPAPPVE